MGNFDYFLVVIRNTIKNENISRSFSHSFIFSVNSIKTCPKINTNYWLGKLLFWSKIVDAIKYQKFQSNKISCSLLDLICNLMITKHRKIHIKLISPIKSITN